MGLLVSLHLAPISSTFESFTRFLNNVFGLHGLLFNLKLTGVDILEKTLLYFFHRFHMVITFHCYSLSQFFHIFLDGHSFLMFWSHFGAFWFSWWYSSSFLHKYAHIAGTNQQTSFHESETSTCQYFTLTISSADHLTSLTLLFIIWVILCLKCPLNFNLMLCSVFLFSRHKTSRTGTKPALNILFFKIPYHFY